MSPFSFDYFKLETTEITDGMILLIDLNALVTIDILQVGFGKGWIFCSNWFKEL